MYHWKLACYIIRICSSSCCSTVTHLPHVARSNAIYNGRNNIRLVVIDHKKFPTSPGLAEWILNAGAFAPSDKQVCVAEHSMGISASRTGTLQTVLLADHTHSPGPQASHTQWLFKQLLRLVLRTRILQNCRQGTLHLLHTLKTELILLF